MALELSKSQYALLRKSKDKYLYTKGFEYSLDGKNYIGEYNKDGNRAWTGPVKTVSSKLLRKFYTEPMLYDYDRSKSFPKRERITPNQIVWAPIEANYKTGYATRYFVERIGNMEGYPIEIDSDQKSRYGKEKGIDEGVYILVTIPWKLTGPERSIYKNGELWIEGIYEHNQRQVILNTPKIPNLEYAIKSYTEYARITMASTNMIR
jgi:hypothetical protein